MSLRHVLTIMSLWVGLAAAPVGWAVAMQLGQILPYVDCAEQIRSSAAVAAAATVIAVLSGGASWWSVHRGRLAVAAKPSTLRFVGLLGAMTSFVFAFALALQTVASMVLSGCER